MKRITITSALLLLVLIMLVLPNYPALHYYFYKNATISNSDVSLDNSHTLLGDFKYLAAISKRAAKTKEKRATPPPKPHKEVNNIVFLLSNIHLQADLKILKISYSELIAILTWRFIPVNNPPPKA